MSKSLNIQIPEPCHENWAEMKPADKGRFCLSCQKQVVDFSVMTDRQVLEYFSNYTGSTCGRFSDEQLNRDIAAGIQKPTIWYKYVLSLFVPAVLLAGKSMAQGTVVKKDTTVCTPVNPSSMQGDVAVTLGRVAPTFTIAGTITDYAKNPVPFATVTVKGTSHAAAADVDGKFALKTNLRKQLTLVVSSVGYEVKEVSVDATKGQKSDTLDISMDLVMSQMSSGVIVTVHKKKKQTVFHKFNRIIADSLGKRSLVLYPNAAKPGATVNISYKLDKGRYIIRVYNNNGQAIHEEAVNIGTKVTGTAIRLHNSISSGQYVVAITDNKGKKIGSGQLIVQ